MYNFPINVKPWYVTHTFTIQSHDWCYDNYTTPTDHVFFHLYIHLYFLNSEL